MRLTFPNQINDKAKQELQNLMPRLLEILREILAGVHEERVAIETDHMSGLQGLLDHRQALLGTFDNLFRQFESIISLLPGLPEGELSFLQSLLWVEENLQPEDVEMHLLTEQLTCIIKEMAGKTHSLVHFLEKKSGSSHPRGLVLKKAAVNPARIAIGLADDDTMDE